MSTPTIQLFRGETNWMARYMHSNRPVVVSLILPRSASACTATVLAESMCRDRDTEIVVTDYTDA